MDELVYNNENGNFPTFYPKKSTKIGFAVAQIDRENDFQVKIAVQGFTFEA